MPTVSLQLTVAGKSSNLEIFDSPPSVTVAKGEGSRLQEMFRQPACRRLLHPVSEEEFPGPAPVLVHS